ncbi:iron-sulfur cluster co-chaperone protein HscB, mitochondrial-like [Tetranychus urticae]|uniref:iron-sulfur cluster co-chaperone protein HscB, mitochondrial-like n=1 Tax=Tetranychus urticae TaxID=32264 RepID=UPI00077C04A2|nr:iron-sulfur cluster co-chaperone protein HscB, mitochondrial-like [Tetranychus urticae]
MMRSQSLSILNLIKRSGTVSCGGLNRLFNNCDSKWFASLEIINQNPRHFLQPNPQIYITDRLFCANKLTQCWQCGSKFRESLPISCTNCLAPQLNHPELNYFTVFNLKATYDVDVPEIRQRFLDLQKILHPDKYSNRSLEEQYTSLDLSTFVNKAYKVLQNPYKRGIYLLKLNGIHREEREGNTVMDPDFLEDMLSINEAVLESSIEGLEKIRSDVQSKVNHLVSSISRSFQTNSLQEVELLLNKLKFYVNILDKITEKE